MLLSSRISSWWLAFCRSGGLHSRGVGKKKKKKKQNFFSTILNCIVVKIFFSLTLITTLLIWLCRLIFPFTWILLFTCTFFSLTNSMHHLCYFTCFHSSSVLKQKAFSKYYISPLAAPSQWQFYHLSLTPLSYLKSWNNRKALSIWVKTQKEKVLTREFKMKTTSKPGIAYHCSLKHFLNALQWLPPSFMFSSILRRFLKTTWDEWPKPSWLCNPESSPELYSSPQ